MRLVASPETAVVGVDQPELAGQRLQRERNRLAPNEVNRVEDAAVQHNGRPRTAVVLEVDARPVSRVRRVRHAKRLMSFRGRRLAGAFLGSVRPRAQQQGAETRGQRPRRSHR